MLRRTLSLCAVLFAALAATAQAAPPPGSLVQPAPPDACFSTDSGGGCSAFGGDLNVGGVGAFELSPDGRVLYVSGARGGSVTFVRDAAGRLTPSDSAFGGAIAAAVSPDGRNVYFQTHFDSSDGGGVFDFSRDATNGALKFISCTDDPAPPRLGVCADGAGLHTTLGDLAASPDGKNVYAAVGDGADGTLATFNRGGDGSLKQVACLARIRAATGLCSNNNPLFGLRGAAAVAISPDGQSVYVAGFGDGAVFGLSRSSQTGALGAPINCVAGVEHVEGEPHCAAIAGLQSPVDLAVSPDGSDLYVADHHGALVALRRNTLTGVLTANGCFGHDPTCTPDALAGVSVEAVDVSPDGRTVYAVGGTQDDGWLEVYSRDPATGRLALLDCLSQLAAGGCRPAAGLKGATAVQVSSDGRNVYTGSTHGGSGDGAVSVFDVVPPADPAPAAPAPPTVPAGPVTPPPAAPAAPKPPAVDAAPTSKIAAPAAKVVKAKALKKITGTALDDHALARVEVSIVKAKSKKTGPGRFVRASGTGKWSLKLKKKLAKGKYVVFSRAIDSAGHVESKFGAANRRTITVK